MECKKESYRLETGSREGAESHLRTAREQGSGQSPEVQNDHRRRQRDLRNRLEAAKRKTLLQH